MTDTDAQRSDGTSSPPPTDETWMRAAIAEARLAEEKGEVPVGAIVVHQNATIGRGHNLRETTQDPLAHAEIIAIQQAATALQSWRLIDCTLYVTLEPCAMCAGALVNSRIARVVWGCDDPKAGATKTLYDIGTDARLNHRFAIEHGVLRDECATLLTNFFRKIRKQ
ncbi:MAG: tRNA adenosine(34) deaminase TadA [Polyangiales bacterium]